MTTRYVIQIQTLARGIMYYSEHASNKLDFNLVMAKRFIKQEEARKEIVKSLRNRSCKIIAIKA